MTNYLTCSLEDFQRVCATLGYEALKTGREYWAGDLALVLRYQPDEQRLSLTMPSATPDLLTDVLAEV